ncbi:hypothetical protein Hanom_Chr09g00780981 [Helianthus anomalus]
MYVHECVRVIVNKKSNLALSSSPSWRLTAAIPPTPSYLHSLGALSLSLASLSFRLFLMLLGVYENTCELGLARNRVTMVVRLYRCLVNN